MMIFKLIFNICPPLVFKGERLQMSNKCDKKLPNMSQPCTQISFQQIEVIACYVEDSSVVEPLIDGDLSILMTML